MDQWIRKALKEKAGEVSVPPGAWERVRERLSPPAGQKRERPSAWARLRPARWEVAVACLLVAALGAIGLVRIQRNAASVRPEPPVTAPQDDLNPVVVPPSSDVTEAPGLPVVTPPEGFLSQSEAKDRARAAAVRYLGMGGRLTLVAMRVQDHRWVAEFQAEGPVLALGGGPRVDDVRKESSRLRLLDRLTIGLDGKTGATHSAGLERRRLPTPANLEHYRGRIAEGGASVLLRLVGPDGTFAGRELRVHVPDEALDRVKYWHLLYGQGRLMDVWGLSTRPGEVIAYRVEMPDPPPYDLPFYPLRRGVPLPPWDHATEEHGGEDRIRVPKVAPEAVRQWYTRQLPRYGWQPLSEQPAPDGRLTFQSAWRLLHLQVLPDGDGAAVLLTWEDALPKLPARTPQEAIDAVFRQVRQDPAYHLFPRSPGSWSGWLLLGGEAPGQQYPATYQTEAWQADDGAFRVRLTLRWGNGLTQLFTAVFRVARDGSVTQESATGQMPYFAVK